MHDLPSVMLLQQSHATPRSGEDLEVFGKCAAQKYVNGKSGTLTSAVVETVKHAGLSPEQVKRVIEFANTDAYLSEHHKEGSDSKYVEFTGGPADPGEVLRDLNDGGGGTVFDRGLADYGLPPIQKSASVVDLASRNLEVLEKTAAASGYGPSLSDIAGDMANTANQRHQMPAHRGFDPFGEHGKRRQVAMLQAMGHTPVVAKHAEAELLDFDPGEAALKLAFAAVDTPLEFENPLAPAFEARDKLAGAAEHMTSELSMLEGQFRDALEDVYTHVKEAALSGTSLGQVMAAWQDVVPSEEYVKTAFAHIGTRLVDEEVFPALDAVGESLQKTAHVGMVNPEHPLVGSMAHYCLTLDKLAHTRAARDELAGQRDVLDDYIKEASIASSIGKAVKGVADKGGVVPKVLEAAKAVGKGAGSVTKGVGEVMFGTGSKGAATAGKVVGKAVQYSPHAAAATGALLATGKVKDKARRSRAYQNAKYYARSAVS